MSPFSILILCLAFGLFVGSEAIGSRQGNALHQRRQRQAAVTNRPSGPINMREQGVEDVKQQVNDWLAQAAQSMANTTQRIKSALAATNVDGLRNGSSVVEWMSMRNDIATGLNLIINGYKTYISLVQKILADIIKYVQGMINKYTSELSALYTMKPPAPVRQTGPNNNDQMSESDYHRLMAFLQYYKGSGHLLDFASDSMLDFMRNLMAHHDAIFNRPVDTWQTFNVGFSVNDDQRFLSCNDLWENNGYSDCANGVADASLSLASTACGCVF